jgi:hypothetical protein
MAITAATMSIVESINFADYHSAKRWGMLIDEMMPQSVAGFRAERIIAGRTDRVWAAARSIGIRTLWPLRVLLWLREWPSRVAGRPLEQFPIVAERPGQELVRGICGQLWAVVGNIEEVDDIAGFAREGYAKAYWSFRVEDMGRGQTRVIVETRVQTYGEGARRKFMRYWRLVRPVVEWSRRAMLVEIERRALR